jgi:hypothetical protein
MGVKRWTPRVFLLALLNFHFQWVVTSKLLTDVCDKKAQYRVILRRSAHVHFAPSLRRLSLNFPSKSIFRLFFLFRLCEKSSQLSVWPIWLEKLSFSKKKVIHFHFPVQFSFSGNMCKAEPKKKLN